MCWHGLPSTGRLIIDDPLLTETYGCLDFSALRNSMRSAGYGTSIAFIPWNQWRTSKTRAGRIFDGRPDLTICVHGCDHTNREFEDGDAESLRWKSDTALRRMECHRSRTGLAFEPVMVFPQGKFSSLAIGALHASGYLAAVNTTCFPANGEAMPLTIADFLRPAITKFFGFPLFQRRHPRRLVDFAFDIFIGRPILLVQHHQDFRDGFHRLEEFVAALHRLDPAMTWPPLSDQLMQSCMMRSLPDGSREVRFFTSRFRFRNTEPTPSDLVFTRDRADASTIARVEINGVDVPFSFRDGFLTIAYRAEPAQIVEVEIADLPRSSAAVWKRPTLAHTAAVGLRRTLSEIRDRTLVKHPRLLTAASWMATKLKVTGESAQ
jgi:hypothetical protein